MTEKQMLRTFVLFLLFVVVLLVSSVANAAVTITPSVSGFARDAISGGYLNNAAGDGQRAFDVASRTYTGTGSFDIAGKALTAPAKIPLVATAGTIVKTAIRLNPAGIVGTLAAGWLIDQGLEWSIDHWTKTTSGTETSCPADLGLPQTYTCFDQGPSAAEHQVECDSQGGASDQSQDGHDYCTFQDYVRTTRPATQPDWDAAPDPIPTVGPELPYVGYMPKGAPVDAPKYDFAPYSVPSGEPYKKPDGSTVQPMVTISSNNTNITYNTWNQTIINNLGEPVVDAPPIDENKDETKDPCDTNPDRLGCAKLDEATAEAMPAENRDIEMISPVSVGGAGQCPAPLTASFLGQAVEFSFDPLCTYAEALRPVVLVLAWLSSGLIFIGGVRS